MRTFLFSDLRQRLQLDGDIGRTRHDAKLADFGKLADDALGLRVKYVGEYGEHAVAKKAGFKKDDVLVSVDRQTSHLTESELFRFLLQNKMPGEKISVTVLRGSERMNLELPMQ